jgi:hypothetical protein
MSMVTCKRRRQTRRGLGVAVLCSLAAWACSGEPGSTAPAGGQAIASEAPADGATVPPSPDVVELQWEQLMPADYRPEAIFETYDLSELSDDDPRAQVLMDEMQQEWKAAPVVDAWDGQTVRLPGFIVPLEGDEKTVSEFLLVPYFGACIHVPPPPSNQIVHVTTGGAPVPFAGMWDAVHVTGHMRTKHFSNDLADAGYSMEAISIEPYE